MDLVVGKPRRSVSHVFPMLLAQSPALFPPLEQFIEFIADTERENDRPRVEEEEMARATETEGQKIIDYWRRTVRCKSSASWSLCM